MGTAFGRFSLALRHSFHLPADGRKRTLLPRRPNPDRQHPRA